MGVILEIIRSESDPGTRAFAAYVLRQAGPGARSAIPALKAALHDKDKTVRRAAASALKKIEPPGSK
jgi:HEAT repeat protein